MYISRGTRYDAVCIKSYYIIIMNSCPHNYTSFTPINKLPQQPNQLMSYVMLYKAPDSIPRAPVKQKKAKMRSGVTQSSTRLWGVATTFSRTATDTPGIQPSTKDTWYVVLRAVQ